MELRETITALCAEGGPSGFEGAVMDKVAAMVLPLVESVERDVLGNVIAWKRCGVPGAPVVMLDAHMDEVGLIVTGYEKGFLRFASVGGIDARILPAAEVILWTDAGPLRGVIDVLPPHVLTAAEREKPLKADKLFIDAGFTTEEEATAHVSRGTPVTFDSPVLALGEHRICGKALDDRSCAAVILSALEILRDKKLAVDMAAVFSAQEEIGGRGAVVGAYGVRPDYALALDVTFARSPGVPEHQAFKIDCGAVIAVGTPINRGFSDRLIALAKERSIPYELEVLSRSTGTDADDISLTRGGVATGVLSVPLRYMHTPTEVIDLRSAKAAAELTAAWVESFGEEN